MQKDRLEIELEWMPDIHVVRRPWWSKGSVDCVLCTDFKYL